MELKSGPRKSVALVMARFPSAYIRLRAVAAPFSKTKWALL
jgi:hypothetical protein